MDTTNEQGRGRRVPPYPTVTLPDSGYTVSVRRIAADALQQIQITARRELDEKKPAVPVIETELGPEENQADPDYQQALVAWQDEVTLLVGMKFMTLVASYAVVTPTDEQAVSNLRDAMAAIGSELPGSDRDVFIWGIVAPTEQDRQTLMAFVVGKSLPTEAAVQAQRDTFRGDVAGA